MKNREFVSRIVNDISALTKDQRVSKRWILSIGKNIANAYVAQHWADGTLTNDTQLFTPIKCVPMIPITKVDCCPEEFRLCETIYRSKERIPGIINSRFGPIILSVSNVVNTLYYKRSNQKANVRNKNRLFNTEESTHVYWIDDSYLYIPERIELINITIVTDSKSKAKQLSQCKDNDDTNNNCLSLWDDEFVVPARLSELVLDKTLNEVRSRLDIPVDENPNMDSNQRTQTIQ